MKARIKNYLSVTKKEWNGMVVLVIIIIGVLLVPYVYRQFHKDTTINLKDFDKDVAALQQAKDVYPAENNRPNSYKTGDEYVSNKVAPGVIIEINSADSAKLTQIRGIGPAFAQRIIEYRTRLGGFLNKEQLKEVYGIDTAKYAQLKNEVSVTPRVTKIKINEVDFEGLRKFPYFTNKQTNAVIQYRKQHGDYHSIADMKNIMILDDDILRKIEPYINFK